MQYNIILFLHYSQAFPFPPKLSVAWEGAGDLEKADADWRLSSTMYKLCDLGKITAPLWSLRPHLPNSMSLYEKQMKDCLRKPPVHGNLLDLWITTFRNSFRTLVSHSQPEIRFDTVEINSFIHSRAVEATDRFYSHLLKKQNSPHSTLIKESFSCLHFASPSFVPGSQLFRHSRLETPVITNIPLPNEYQQGCSNSISGIWAQICLLWVQSVCSESRSPPSPPWSGSRH